MNILNVGWSKTDVAISTPHRLTKKNRLRKDNENKNSKF